MEDTRKKFGDFMAGPAWGDMILDPNSDMNNTLADRKALQRRHGVCKKAYDQNVLGLNFKVKDLWIFPEDVEMSGIDAASS